MPPFLGTKIVESISLGDVESFINKKSLLLARWQFKDENDEKVKNVYEKTLAKFVSRDLFGAKILYGHFKCEKSGNGLVVEHEGRHHRFDFPREVKSPNRCIADFFESGFASAQLVTIGSQIDNYLKELFSEKKFSDVFYLKGFASEVTEALASYSHEMIRRELGVEEGVGARFSPGYNSFPDLLSQRKLDALLKFKTIGVSLTKTCMLFPEHSTTAMISIDPKAVQFNPKF